VLGLHDLSQKVKALAFHKENYLTSVTSRGRDRTIQVKRIAHSLRLSDLRRTRDPASGFQILPWPAQLMASMCVLQARAPHDGMNHQGMHHAWKRKGPGKCIFDIISPLYPLDGSLITVVNVSIYLGLWLIDLQGGKP
jgi:hypothetical protein